MVKIVCFFLLSLLLYACSISNYSKNSKVVYHVFGALEDYLQGQIIQDNKELCVVIDPKCIHNYYRIGSDSGDFSGLFEIKLHSYNSFMGDIKVSNRYIMIHGKLFPIYIEFMDNIFKEFRRNDTYSDLFAISSIPYDIIRVDMKNKEFYSYVNRIKGKGNEKIHYPIDSF